MKTIRALVFSLAVGCGSNVAEPYSVSTTATERFTLCPLESLALGVPQAAVEWRLAGNPRLVSTPFAEGMWFSLADDGASADNIDFFTGPELYADRLTPVPVGNARLLLIDNAGSQCAQGAIVWGLAK